MNVLGTVRRMHCSVGRWYVRASRYRFPGRHAEIHGAQVVPRWPMSQGVRSPELTVRNRLILRWTFIVCGVSMDLHHTLGASHGGRRWGSGVGFGRSGRQHVEGLGGGATLVGSRSRIEVSFGRGASLTSPSRFDWGFGISSKFHGTPGRRGVWWVILAAWSIHRAKVLCHCVLIAWWCVVKDGTGIRGYGWICRPWRHRGPFVSILLCRQFGLSFRCGGR